MSQADLDIFNADMDTFFDLAFAREQAGTMTIGQIGRLFPSHLHTAMDETGMYRDPGERIFSADEDAEIAESYAELDRLFFEEEARLAEEAERAEDEHWLAIQERLTRRDNRRKVRILQKRKFGGD